MSLLFWDWSRRASITLFDFMIMLSSKKFSKVYFIKLNIIFYINNIFLFRQSQLFNIRIGFIFKILTLIITATILSSKPLRFDRKKYLLC